MFWFEGKTIILSNNYFLKQEVILNPKREVALLQARSRDASFVSLWEV